MKRMPPVFKDRCRAPALALIAASGIVQAFAAGVAAFATRDIFAALGGGAPLPEMALAIVLGAGILIAGLRLADKATGEYVGQHYAAALRQKLFVHLSKLPASKIAGQRTGSLAVRFIGDLSAIRAWVSLGVARIISAAFVIPGALIALGVLNPTLAVICGSVLVVSLLLMAVFQSKLAPIHRRLRRLRGRIAADMNERIPVTPELRIQGRMKKETLRLEQQAGKLRSVAVKRSFASGVVCAIPEIGLACTGALFLGAAFPLGLNGAELAAALAMLSILVIPLRQLGTIADRYRAWEVARGKCLKVLAIRKIRKSHQEGIDQQESYSGLQFKNISVGPLQGITARIEPEECVTIMGPNGAGKSTLLSLVAGLESPTQGTARLNGKPVERKDICYVGVRSPILRGSLRRALTMGLSRRPSDKEIGEVVDQYGLTALQKRLGGLDGVVAEAGKNLSSGETRRIHLARAALTRPRILLLDEPDDALDPGGWTLVQKLIKETPAITLCVTHNPVLARTADTVWFIADGQLAESGSPEQLLEMPGLSRDFVAPSRVV